MTEPSAKLSPGVRLGRYEIVSAIGAGGMGQVFRAIDTVLGRPVAVKVLPDRVAREAEARQRFEREARILASLSHPNILAIHDFGDADGIVFAVMELLEGESLRDRLRRGPVPIDLALAHARTMAAGLAAAHAKEVIHRDLKPENVFLTAEGLVKILDFGLARLGGPESDTIAAKPDTFATQPGTILGTVGYMSPEQLRGEDTDARTDVFALGAVLFEMLTGRAPFAAKTPVDTMSAVLHQEPPPLPAALMSAGAVVRTCLQKDPGKRFRSARELLSALELLDRPGAGAASSPGVIADAAAPSIAVLPFADMSADRSLDYLCEGVAEEIIMALTRIEGLRVVARSSAFQFKGASEDVRSIGRGLGVGSVLEGSVRASAGRVRVSAQLVSTTDGYQLWSERFDRRLDDLFALQDEIAASVASALRVHFRGARESAAPPRSIAPAGYAAYLKGRHHWNRRTEADLRQSVEYFDESIRADPSFAAAHAGLAETYATLAIYGAMAPGEAMPLARSAADRALAIDPAAPGALAALGGVRALYDWAWADAEPLFRRAIEAMPGASTTRAWYAMNFLVPRGRFDEADTELRRALDVDPLSLPINAGLGVTAYFAQRYDDAESGLRRALGLDPAFAMARYFLGLTLAEHRPELALPEIDAAIQSTGGSPEMTGAAAYALARAGRRDDALARAHDLLATAERRYVSPGLIGQVYAGIGDTGASLDWLERAVATRATDLAWIGVRPTWNHVRSHPRFEELRKMIEGQT